MIMITLLLLKLLVDIGYLMDTNTISMKKLKRLMILHATSHGIIIRLTLTIKDIMVLDI